MTVAPRARGRVLARAAGVLAAWLAGVVVVKLGLAWADTYPYSQASEVRYGLVAVVAMSVAIGGTVISLLWRRVGVEEPGREEP